MNGGAGATATGSDGGYYSGPRANLNATDGARFHRRGQERRWKRRRGSRERVGRRNRFRLQQHRGRGPACGQHRGGAYRQLKHQGGVRRLAELDGLHASGDSGGSQTTTSTSNETVDLTKLAVRGDLIVGFYQPTGTALGALTSATFPLTTHGYQFINQTFSGANTATLAQTYFPNHAMDLGLVGSGLLGGNTLTLQATMTVTTGAGNSGFFGTLIIGDPPSATGPATIGSRAWRR